MVFNQFTSSIIRRLIFNYRSSLAISIKLNCYPPVFIVYWIRSHHFVVSAGLLIILKRYIGVSRNLLFLLEVCVFVLLKVSGNVYVARNETEAKNEEQNCSCYFLVVSCFPGTVSLTSNYRLIIGASRQLLLKLTFQSIIAGQKSYRWSPSSYPN